MNLNPANINSLWSSLLIEELTRHDITHFFISPGSRSTPLTVAAARHPKAESVVHFDERGAAFAALGYARGARRPAALICTSGTAVANYLPAVVEAYLDRVPMILLTADRPPELQDCGANQTIRQPGIFSHYIRHELNLPSPDTSVRATALLSLIDRAVYSAESIPAGPVHINCPFREPLAPVDDGQDYTEYLNAVGQWMEQTSPYTVAGRESKAPDRADMHTLAESINAASRGIIVAGKLDSESERDAVIELSERIGWPVLPDIQSGLRLGLVHPNVISNYDLVLHSDQVKKHLAPDCCLHIGGRVTSKRLLQWLDHAKPTQYIMVDGEKREFDPNHQVTLRIDVSFAAVWTELSKHTTPRDGSDHLVGWQTASERTREAMAQLIDTGELNEPSIAHLLSHLILPRHALWLASSMPVRLMDMFGACTGEMAPIGANRGASGIDGTIASATGLARGLGRPTTLLIGDLALLHDLNSLSLAAGSRIPITIIILNNDGGGIFALLPIAEHHDVFERWFTAPHGMTFASAADQFGLPYERVDTLDGFQKAYLTARDAPYSSIIEIACDRSTTVGLIHRVGQTMSTLSTDQKSHA